MGMADARAMEERRQKILDRLALDGVVRVTQLSVDLQVTPATVRSDLAALEERGLVHRTQGGAVPAAQSFAAQPLHTSPGLEEKRAIGEYLAGLVQDGETLLINSGTTTLCAAIALKRKRTLRIVTNSIAVAMELGEQPGFRVILLGGDINTQFGFIYGDDAQTQLSRYKADKAILSVDGILPPTPGLTTYHGEEAMLDAQMMDRAQQTIVLAAPGKFGRESFSVVGQLASVDTVITNQGADQGIIAQLERTGIQVLLAEI